MLRLRTDFWWEAGKKRAVLLGAVEDPRLVELVRPGAYAESWLRQLDDPTVEPAREGDAWIIRGDPTDGRTFTLAEMGRHADWPIIGYGLWCPNEECHYGMHMWTHASDCPAHDDHRARCKHGTASCWAWTGSIEEGTLTASPSLFCNFPECGWHGFLSNGSMRGTVEVVSRP